MEVVVIELVVHEGAGGEELVIVELAFAGVLVEVLPEEGSELVNINAAPDEVNDGVGEVGEHREAAASVRIDGGSEPSPESLGVGHVIFVGDVGSEENIEHVVLDPVREHLDDGIDVVHDGITIDSPHVVGGESAADVDIGAGYGTDIVVLVSGGDGKESDKSESCFHCILYK